MHEPILASITSRLYYEFDGRLPVADIITTVLRCERDVSGLSESALPEIVERLARHRLTERLVDEPVTRD